GTGGLLRPIARLHVTILAVGPSAGFVPRLKAAQAAAAGAWFAPFELSFTHIGSLGRDRGGMAAVALIAGDGAEAVRDLAGRLGGGLRLAGSRPGGSMPEIVHATLLYDRAEVPQTRLSRPIRVAVDSFCLVRGLPGAPDYDELGRWPGKDI